MLILTRRANQSIEVGSDIIVKILNINGTQVRLGIKAPKDIPVHRDEVARRIRLELADKKAQNPGIKRAGSLARG